MEIRYVNSQDIEAITNIYNDFVVNSTATFEEKPVTTEEMSQRVGKIQSYSLPWIVMVEGEKVLGYAYAGLWNNRSAYRNTTEASVYVSPNALGKGIGKALYSHLISILAKRRIRNVLGVVSLPNDASIALHQSLGFQKVGEFKKVGLKFGELIDVSYWQLELTD